MEFTPKQERNGATGATSEQNAAEKSAGPDLTAKISASAGSAEAAAAARYSTPGGE